MKYGAEKLVWIDLETTGLDPDRDQILEIACVVTDANLNEIGDPFVSAVRPDSPITVDLVIVEMHAKNGLWLELRDAPSIAQIDDRLSAMLCGGTALLIAGSSVHFDKAFLRRHMPRTYAFFNHRVFDVSTLKAAMRMWHEPGWCADQTVPAHRALGDIRGSIEVARAFRRAAPREIVIPPAADPFSMIDPFATRPT